MTPTTGPLLPTRSSGLLLHPTSLPGPYGIGDLGPAAHAWVQTLARCHQTWWQILPLGQTGYAESPYSTVSAFAGSIYLLSPDLLFADGLIGRADLTEHVASGRVDWGPALAFKAGLLARAWANFDGGAAPELRTALQAFCAIEADWINDYALYAALKEVHGGKAWWDWPRSHRFREPAALAEARTELRDAISRHIFGQFLFDRQLSALRQAARAHGVRILGDVPIFVAGDSADVWAHPEWFLLDEQRRPTAVSGVPPDYFSATGQLWGNPLYDWEALERSDFAWWIARLRSALRQADHVRLDHFRGFEAYWAVPAGAVTAESGHWIKAPGEKFLQRVQTALGGLPFVAEDLGVITSEVDALRLGFGLPGMRVLQFAFGGAIERRFLPHFYDRNSVVYTGTHDNDTTCGWYGQLSVQEMDFLEDYAPDASLDPAWTLLRLAWASVADTAIAPVQDILGLGTESRMNYPGRAQGNWAWRLQEGQLTEELLDHLAFLTEVYDRNPPREGPVILDQRL